MVVHVPSRGCQAGLNEASAITLSPPPEWRHHHYEQDDNPMLQKLPNSRHQVTVTTLSPEWVYISRTVTTMSTHSTSSLQRLPGELLTAIFGLVRFQDIRSLALTSKVFRDAIAGNKMLFKAVYLQSQVYNTYRTVRIAEADKD